MTRQNSIPPALKCRIQTFVEVLDPDLYTSEIPYGYATIFETKALKISWVFESLKRLSHEMDLAFDDIYG